MRGPMGDALKKIKRLAFENNLKKRIFRFRRAKFQIVGRSRQKNSFRLEKVAGI